eukprot:CAMPEP_0113496252 /NCGR_PEP_ID=MMETSP0014_2-20120614/30025_1 /TAXON_ID=2857 /ORGANISM="Nitzschia sp." /LENGTH=792 /DNA_ID=CAMNT_0000390167 /DNA_START=193 /DNA_END=2567 /DNA_ORIENTATION=+ /assembly_acc=CAM_ASM_000159
MSDHFERLMDEHGVGVDADVGLDHGGPNMVAAMGTVPVPVPVTAAAAPRSRGRPKGSKNKPKQQDHHHGGMAMMHMHDGPGLEVPPPSSPPAPGPKRRGKRQTAPLVWSGQVPSEDETKLKTSLTSIDVSAYWPHGWRKETYGRPSTNSKTSDSYWFSPHKNYKLRSLPDVQRFLEALVQTCDGDESKALLATTQYGRSAAAGGGAGGDGNAAGGGGKRKASPSAADGGVTSPGGGGGGRKKRSKKIPEGGHTSFHHVGVAAMSNHGHHFLPSAAGVGAVGVGVGGDIKIKQRRTKSGKKDKNAPKGPMSAYVYFALDRRPQILLENPDIDPFKGVGAQLGAEWKNLDPEKKKEYEMKAAQDRARYKAEFEAFKEKVQNNAALAAAAATAAAGYKAEGDGMMPSMDGELIGGGMGNDGGAFAAASAAGMITTMTPDGQVITAAPIKRTTMSKRGGRRKDPNAPKRALGAYNYFVKRQNQMILQVVQAEDPFDPEINDPTSPDYIGPDMLQKLKIADGKVNFHEVGRLVGHRWRSIAAEDKVPYEDLAAQDMERFKREMDGYDPDKAGGGYGGGNILIGEDGAPFHSHDSNKRSKLGVRAKKAKDAPKQALSAYNYFFQAERDRIARIVADPNDTTLNDPTDPESYIPPEILASLYVEGKQTTAVGKYIGQRWKAMKSDPSRRSIYDDMASEDMGRFNRELDAYKSKKEMERGSSAATIDATATAAAAAAAAGVAAAGGHHHHHHHHHMAGTAGMVDDVTALAAAAAASMHPPNEEANGIVAAAVDAMAQAHS